MATFATSFGLLPAPAPVSARVARPPARKPEKHILHPMPRPTTAGVKRRAPTAEPEGSHQAPAAKAKRHNIPMAVSRQKRAPSLSKTPNAASAAGSQPAEQPQPAQESPVLRLAAAQQTEKPGMTFLTEEEGMFLQSNMHKKQVRAGNKIIMEDSPNYRQKRFQPRKLVQDNGKTVYVMTRVGSGPTQERQTLRERETIEKKLESAEFKNDGVPCNKKGETRCMPGEVEKVLNGT